MIPARDFAGYLFETYALPFSDPMQAGIGGTHVKTAGYDPASYGLAVHDMGAGAITPAPGAIDGPTVKPAGFAGDIGKSIVDAIAPFGIGIAGAILGGALVALGLYAFAKG